MSALGMEQILRPFVEVRSTPTPRAVSAAPGPVTAKAFIRWGKPSKFAAHDFRSEAKKVAYYTTQPDPEPDKRIRRVYTLMGRATDKVRYENPDDPDMYVIMKNARGLHYQGPDGADVQLQIKAMKQPGTETADGQDPESPDLGELHERPQWLDWHHRHPNA